MVGGGSGLGEGGDERARRCELNDRWLNSGSHCQRVMKGEEDTRQRAGLVRAESTPLLSLLS